MRIKRVIVDEMPKSCNYCKLIISIGQYAVCSATREGIDEWEQRPAWCPLEVETDGWIAVSERLPETYETVLVALGKGVTEARYSKPHKFVGMCQGWHAVDGYCFGNKVTHWRPLPQPPEVKNE